MYATHEVAKFYTIVSYGTIFWGALLSEALTKRAVLVLCGLDPRDSCRQAFVGQELLTVVNINCDLP